MAAETFDFVLHLDEYNDIASVFGECKLVRGESTARVTASDLCLLAGYGKLLNEAWATKKDGARAGEVIFKSIFKEGIGQLFDKASREAEKQGNPLRLVIKYDLPGGSHKAEGVHEVPWELIFHPERQKFIALDSSYLLVRHLRGTAECWKPVTGPRRLLLTAACPANYAPLKLDSELAQVECSLRGEVLNKAARLDKMTDVGAQSLRRTLNHSQAAGRSYHIWHHCGHADENAAGEAGLVLHAADGAESLLGELCNPAQMADIVARQEDLRLVVLNVCLGAKKRGLASLLAHLQVPAVIGYPCPASDSMALVFAQSLWRSLSSEPVDFAVRSARAALAATPQTLDFAKVVVFLRALDDRCLLFL